MKKRKYDYLLQDYPNYLTKEDFYKIAHISKATARYLLQSGKVPCKDTGKKTHRYLIPTENAIRYLEDREIHPDEYEAEPGWYSGKVKHGKKRRRSKKRKQKINAARNKLKELTDAKLEELEDLLDINDICRLTGFSNTAVLRWCRSGKLKAFMVSGKYLIPKVCLKDYIATKCGTANINKEENIMFNNLKENDQQGNMRGGQSLPKNMTDEEMDRRINESVIGRYGYGGMISIVPLDRTIDDAYREVTIDMIKDGEIPLNYDTISSLHLTADEIREIQDTLEKMKLLTTEIVKVIKGNDLPNEVSPDKAVPPDTKEENDELDRLVSESVLGKYGFGDLIRIVPVEKSINASYRQLAIELIKLRHIPLDVDTILDLRLTLDEIQDIKNALDEIRTPSSYRIRRKHNV